jgi:leukotriene-A4 hydrolase
VTPDPRDHHSYSEPDRVRVKHLDLSLHVDFEVEILIGSATLEVERIDQAAPLILDTRDLKIESVEAVNRNVGADQAPHSRQLRWSLGPIDPILGAPLLIELTEDGTHVAVHYRTSPAASGLQWLRPGQTAGKEQPFLFSQSQSIHARSWIPIQDSPGVRFTYSAAIDASLPLTPLMAAESRKMLERPDGAARIFRMHHPVPAYLVAVAVGEIRCQPIGPRTAVYAEPAVVSGASAEFEDMERMVETVESLYGPYRWDRYDVLVLPPSFPFGGMENPMLTFATPTILAGDKSLVSLISHELAHSWSGNLVTNATWRDFWLNEGFTTYIENRIQEALYGREQALMEQVIDHRELETELASHEPQDQILHIDLTGRDPDEGCTRIPYIKGALLLRLMEQTFGRAAFDRFLNRYFDRFAFQSITTSMALDYLRQELFAKYPEQAKAIDLEEWVFQPGLPEAAPKPQSDRLDAVAQYAFRWSAGDLSAGQIETGHWVTQEWIEFLQRVSRPLTLDQAHELDDAFQLTGRKNSEVLFEWLQMAIESLYEPAFPRLEEFLLTVGRGRFIRPLYTLLRRDPRMREWAAEIYVRARPGYHTIARTALDKLFMA